MTIHNAGATPESVPRGNRPANEAAERLRERVRLWVEPTDPATASNIYDDLRAALRAERLAVVEEMGEALTAHLDGSGDPKKHQPELCHVGIREWFRAERRRILDEVGVAGLTEEHKEES